MSSSGKACKRARRILRDEFVGSLSEFELAGLAWLLLKKTSHPLKGGVSYRSYVVNFGPKFIFGCIHEAIHGIWNDNVSIFRGMYRDDINGIKDALGKISSEKSFYPKMPEGLTVKNERIGEIAVNIHAWKRFCERFCKNFGKIGSETVIMRLSQSFAIAKPVELVGGYKVLRVMNNNFDYAQYFLDKVLNCRFVVVQNNGRLELITAEVPYSR